MDSFLALRGYEGCGFFFFMSMLLTELIIAPVVLGWFLELGNGLFSGFFLNCYWLIWVLSMYSDWASDI